MRTPRKTKNIITSVDVVGEVFTFKVLYLETVDNLTALEAEIEAEYKRK